MILQSSYGYVVVLLCCALLYCDIRLATQGARTAYFRCSQYSASSIGDVELLKGKKRVVLTNAMLVFLVQAHRTTPEVRRQSVL